MRKINLILLSCCLLLLFALPVSATVTQSNVSPPDNATGVWVNKGDVSILLNATQGDMNGTIWLFQGTTQVASQAFGWIGNGTRYLNFSTLEPSTVYTINVTFVDNDSVWNNASYNFTTGNARLRENTDFSGAQILIFGVLVFVLTLGMVYWITDDIRNKRITLDINYLITRLFFLMIMIIIIGVVLALI
jgi:hypothetical protein